MVKNLLNFAMNASQAIERLGRSMSSDEKLIDNLLVLSCEEDFSVCVPLLEKGDYYFAAVFCFICRSCLLLQKSERG